MHASSHVPSSYAYLCGQQGRIWPSSAAQLADWPRLAAAPGSLRRDLALREAFGAPADRGLSNRVFDRDAYCPVQPLPDGSFQSPE
eukprot:scaffold8560_cov66-Phaeocystis_antarctica.AAC.2